MQRVKTLSIMALFLAVVVALTATAYTPEQQYNFVIADSSQMDIHSCRYTQPEKQNNNTECKLSNLEGFECKLENKRLSVYFREETSGIRILDKQTGYVWGGLDEDAPENMNGKWARMANSIVTVDYFDSTVNSARISLSGNDVYAEYDWSENKLLCSVELDKQKISFDFTMELSEDSIRFILKRNSIKETGSCLLQSVWFVPFLGAAEQDTVDGYMFIPDGSGALIRYAKSANYVSAFDERVYGKDASVNEMSVAGDLIAKRNNDYIIDTPQITIPVFGVVHGAGNNAYLAVINKGDEYSSIYASPAGLITDYNWVSARFDYRNSYSRPVSKSGNGIISAQEKPEHFDCDISYYFLNGDDADYNGMALKYRSLLEKNGRLKADERKDENIPVYLNVCAADVKKAFIGTDYVSLTTIDALKNIISSLSADGLSNLTVKYSGWQKGGLNGASYNQTALDRRLGSKNKLKMLCAYTEKKGGRIFLGTDPLTFNKDQGRTASVSALGITKTYSNVTRNNQNLMYPSYYFLRPGILENYVKKLEKDENFKYSYDDIGRYIYGDYNRDKTVTRNGLRESITKLFRESGKKTLMNNPNSYLWAAVSDYTELPVQNNQYLFETDSVPFLSILLKGSIDCYATYANQGFYSQNSILKMIEYAAYPSFIVMSENNEKLIDTPLADYFSLCFNDWHSVITNVYNKVNNALNQVEGCRITKHEMLTDGIAAVSYDNGKIIYVNYSSSDYTLSDGEKIPANNYLIGEAVQQ